MLSIPQNSCSPCILHFLGSPSFPELSLPGKHHQSFATCCTLPQKHPSCRILKRDEFRSTSSDEDRNNGLFYFLRPPLFPPAFHLDVNIFPPLSVSVSFTYLSRGHIQNILLGLNFVMFYFSYFEGKFLLQD